LFYLFSRFLIRLALPIYLRNIFFTGRHHIPSSGPVLLATNHPNSFFDAVVIGAIQSRIIHTITRGDVFRKPKVAFWLRQINLIPVYRLSEGRQYMHQNAETFQESRALFDKGKVVLIFSEGLCKNEWQLRPLGKGTARMAYQSWYEDNLPLAVVPAGLTYEHYQGRGKRVALHVAPPICPEDIRASHLDPEKWFREFNELLAERLTAHLYQLPTDTSAYEASASVRTYFDALGTSDAPASFWKPIAQLGRWIHRPTYRFLKNIAHQKCTGTVFYDSVLFGLLVYGYPILVLLAALLVGVLVSGWVGALIFILLPLSAYVGSRF
jgi:1-acyl-sn-glycerol-3-phosphate acyltransferase